MLMRRTMMTGNWDNDDDDNLQQPSSLRKMLQISSRDSEEIPSERKQKNNIWKAAAAVWMLVG